MDPALAELLLAEGNTDRMIEAIIRLRQPGLDVPGVRMVARFGTVATCRLRAGDVAAVRAHPNEVSLKLARPLGHDRWPGEFEPVDGDDDAGEIGSAPTRRPQTPLTGAGAVVGVVDWGLDVDHPSFKNRDGTTRLLALWDQRQPPTASSPRPYGYGRVFPAAEINRALASGDPYRRLGYRHAAAASTKAAHGTHVTDIAAGNGRGGGPVGVAPEADLIFVHLADHGTGGLANLGDSVRLLEAIHFIAGAAGDRPWVINCSVGRMGGPHDVSVLVQMAVDQLLQERSGRFLVQSAGNYRLAGTHASGTLAPGESRLLRFTVEEADRSINELEIWYDGTDELAVRIDPPHGRGPTVTLGAKADIVTAGQVVGRVYHRASDPNNGDHHIDAFLYPKGQTGTWTVTLEARRVRSGRFHAWLERDEACPRCQARFTADSRSLACTTGTLANGRVALVVGSYDARRPGRPVAGTSSSGQTRDGQRKPDLGAPGVAVVAARSAPPAARASPGGTTTMSGTSMAAPHVAGAVALCLQASAGRVTARQIRTLVLGSVDSPTTPDPEWRLGHGRLNVAALLGVTQRAFAAIPISPKETIMDLDAVSSPLSLVPARAYRELLYRPDSALARWIDARYELLGRPARRVREAVRPGDVVLQIGLARNSSGRCGELITSELTRRTADPHTPAGWYGEVTDASAPWGSSARRVLDATGCLPAGLVVLRPRSESDPDQADPDDGPADGSGRWTGSADQLAFRDRVLTEAIRRKKRSPLPNLRRTQLDHIAGTQVLTRPETARAVEAMLAAATAALRTAQQAGDADALRTVSITVGSGYRPDTQQRDLWLGYFRKYYNRSAGARQRLAGGPHSDEAIEYLLRSQSKGGFGIGERIAAPGFSNHQGGTAVDLQLVRVPGHQISNDSDARSRAAWRATWPHGWLRANAATFGFRPLPTEEWHWEYSPVASGGTAAAATQAAAQVTTFQPTGYEHPVAVYVPEAAQASTTVDVLLFAHGLLGGCPRPARVPVGLVTDPPFRLGQAIDRSGRPVVLVVPLLDWADPGGEAAFGAGRTRWHSLARPDRLNRLIEEVLARLAAGRGTPPALGELVIAGHSRAYDFLEPLAEQHRDPAMRRGALAKLSRIWAFDTTYGGKVERWTDWLEADPKLVVDVFFRPGSRTAAIGERFERVAGDRLRVTRASEGHCAVPSVRLAELLKPPARRSTDDQPSDDDVFAGTGPLEITPLGSANSLEAGCGCQSADGEHHG